MVSREPCPFTTRFPATLRACSILVAVNGASSKPGSLKKSWPLLWHASRAIVRAPCRRRRPAIPPGRVSTSKQPMPQPPIRFDDGAAYDQSMGDWSPGRRRHLS